MKKFIIILSAIILSFNTQAQVADTMFIHVGQSIFEFSAESVDSVTFYRVDRTITAVPATGIRLNRTLDTLPAGQTQNLTATVLPANATNRNVLWVSNNTDVATVSNGVVTAVVEGDATITAVTEDGALIANYELHVVMPIFNQGLYVRNESDGSVTLIGFDGDLNPHIRTFPNRESVGPLRISSTMGFFHFYVELRDQEITPPPARHATRPEKMLVLSDPHADIIPFVQVLRGNGVMCNDFNWIFGANYLVILGDIFSRGDDQTTIAWILYKLQEQAREAGGAVIFTLGNHEMMNLQGDGRYQTAKYSVIASRLGLINYNRLWTPDMELGRWLLSQNSVVIVDDFLFAHGGISPVVAATGLSIENINDTVRKFIAQPSGAAGASSAHAGAIMGGSAVGVLWYRSIINNELYQYQVDAIRHQFGVEHMIFGHTRVNEMTSFYDGTVFGTDISNVRWPNMQNNLSMAIMITPDSIWPVNRLGEARDFAVFHPPTPANPPAIDPADIPTFVLDPNLETLNAFLLSGNYTITLMSPGLHDLRELYRTEFPAFTHFELRTPRGNFQLSFTTVFDNGGQWFRGPAEDTPMQALTPLTGSGNNPNSDGVFTIPRSTTSSSPPAGHSAGDLSVHYILATIQQPEGWTIIQDGVHFWFRSKADPNVWFLARR